MYRRKSSIENSVTKSTKMQINKEEPIKFKKVSINHSRFVEGTILPKPAPANVVSTKKYDSIYFSFQLGVNIFH